MICPECFDRMVVVDNGGGTPVWICRCKAVLDYEPDEEWGDDDGYEEMKITEIEGNR